MLTRPIFSCWYALSVLVSCAVASDIEIALQKRQNVPVGTGVSVASTRQAAATSTANGPSLSSDSPVPSSSASVTEEVASSTPLSADDTIITSELSPSPTDFSSTPVSSSSSALSSAGAAASTQSASATESSQSQLSRSVSIQTRPVSSRTQLFVTTVVTVSGSSTFTRAVTTSRLEVITASSSPSSSPGLNSGDGSSGKSGLSSGHKHTIIGVVVGIGGAILLGGLAVVAWRIWGRRNAVKPDDYDPMDPPPGSADQEKPNSGSTDPFRTNLDQHHNTGGPVNAASNF